MAFKLQLRVGPTKMSQPMLNSLDSHPLSSGFSAARSGLKKVLDLSMVDFCVGRAVGLNPRRARLSETSVLQRVWASSSLISQLNARMCGNSQGTFAPGAKLATGQHQMT